MTTQKLSKTAAIKEARGYVSIHGSGTSWSICGPYRTSDPDGPYTEVHTCGYSEAVQIRKIWTVELALWYMGKDTEDVTYKIRRANEDCPCSISKLIDIALQA